MTSLYSLSPRSAWHSSPASPSFCRKCVRKTFLSSLRPHLNVPLIHKIPLLQCRRQLHIEHPLSCIGDSTIPWKDAAFALENPFHRQISCNWFDCWPWDGLPTWRFNPAGQVLTILFKCELFKPVFVPGLVKVFPFNVVFGFEAGGEDVDAIPTVKKGLSHGVNVWLCSLGCPFQGFPHGVCLLKWKQIELWDMESPQLLNQIDSIIWRNWPQIDNKM